MKKNNSTPTLEELLNSVEHAGRDARRQQELAHMIERMAEEEAAARRSAFKKWTLRTSVAATVTLFVATSVWRWTQNDTPVAPIVAQAPVLRPTELPLPQPAIQPTTKATRPNATTVKSIRPMAAPISQCTPIAADEPMTVEQETPSATDTQEPILETLKLEEPIWIDNNQLAEASSHIDKPVEATEETPGTAQEQSNTTTDNKQSKKTKRGIFSLFEAEPSLMEGTSLSFNLI